MEHNKVMKKKGYYNWHAGAPDDNSFKKAQEILFEKIKNLLKKINFNDLKTINITPEKINKSIFEIH